METTDIALKLPCILNDLSNENYHNSDPYKSFCGSSTLKLMMTSPLFAKYRMDNPEKKESEAMSQGSVYHSMLASLTNKGNLSDFEDEYFIFDPPKNPKTGESYGFNTKTYQEALEYYINSNSNKLPCSKDEKKIAENMIDVLLNKNPHLSPQINNLIKIGKAEQSHFLEYQGQRFKYRTDLKTSKKIIDWKKTKPEAPKPENWEREIIKYNYHISAAFYQFFEFILTGKWKEFYWIAQESEPPYDFNILSAQNWTYELSQDQERTIVETKIGAEILTKLLDYYILCCERNEWPGYSIFLQPNYLGQRIGFPTVPGWYNNLMFKFFDNK